MYLQIYVHRSGRTARAEREGISIALCSPEEQRLYKNLCSSLKKRKYLFIYSIYSIQFVIEFIKNIFILIFLYI